MLREHHGRRLRARGAPCAGAAALLLASALAPRNASAETLPFGEIVVQRSEAALGCPSEAELVARTLSLGVPRPDAPQEPLKIEVSFTRGESDYIAHIRASGRKTGDRELRERGTDCAPLLDAVAVVLTVLLDLLPQAAVDSAPPAPPAEKVTPPQPPPAQKAEPALQTSPVAANEPSPSSESSGAGTGGGVRLAGGAGYGMLGTVVSPWFSGGGFVTFLGLEGSVEGFWVPMRTIAYQGGLVDVDLFGGGLELCYGDDIAGAPPLRAGACASAVAGALSGAGRGFDTPGSSTDLWLAAGVSIDARFSLTREIGVRVELQSLFSPVMQTFSVDGLGEAFRSSDASVILSVGPELTIW
jgi:hypothetical protein